jgi:hypothetical protein
VASLNEWQIFIMVRLAAGALTGIKAPVEWIRLSI